MKNKKIIILYVLVIFVLGLTAYLVYSISSKADSINENNKADENITNNIVTNELNVVAVSENVIETIEPEDEPEISSEVIDEETVKEIEKEKKIEQTQKDKAIDLVKKAWGKDDSVYFYIDEENSNGKYVVSVRDKDTTSVIEWYDVDIINNTAKIQ